MSDKNTRWQNHLLADTKLYFCVRPISYYTQSHVGGPKIEIWWHTIFCFGAKNFWVSKWRRQEESLETKEKRKETAGMVYSVIINHDKIFQKCFNFFLGGEEGVINNTHLHLNRNKTRNNHWRVNSIWILYSSVICSCSKSYVIGCKLYFCKEH